MLFYYTSTLAHVDNHRHRHTQTYNTHAHERLRAVMDVTRPRCTCVVSACTPTRRTNTVLAWVPMCARHLCVCVCAGNTVTVVDKGPSGCTASKPCMQCQGDCDIDADCDTGLKCFQRKSSSQTVPGCAATGYKASSEGDHDYCHDPFVCPVEDRCVRAKRISTVLRIAHPCAYGVVCREQTWLACGGVHAVAGTRIALTLCLSRVRLRPTA